MTHDPVAIVGDVHGDLAALEGALGWLAVNWTGRVIFVGDYVNRGPDSAAVLNCLADVRESWGDRLILLRGNHDTVLLDFLQRGVKEPFVRHGGLRTMHSYLGASPTSDPFRQFVDSYPARHLDLLRGLVTHYETPQLLVSHAGYRPDEPTSRRVEDLVFGRHAALFRPPLETPRPVVVCGHYVQRKGIYRSPGFFCIDTGCGTLPDGRLTVLLLPDQSVFTFGGS